MEPQKYRVIEGTLYTRAPSPYGYALCVHDLGHGHVEAVALPRFAWHEVAALDALAAADYAAALATPPEPTPRELLDRLADNKARATRRARTKVRRLCKFKGLQVLLTLTYRENMTDRDRMARDLDAFVKRVRRVIRDFEYVCVFERQKRGAWHAHLAVRRVLSHYTRNGVLVKSYDLLRSMWRGVVGNTPDGKSGGNVDVSRNRRVSRSSAKLAAYLSKYIGKTLGDGLDKWSNSYSASGRDLPDAVREVVLGASQLQAVAALLELLGPELGRSEFHHAFLDGGGYYVCLSPPPG